MHQSLSAHRQETTEEENQEARAVVMATESTEMNPGDETLSPSETNVEDYAYDTTSSSKGFDDTLAGGEVTQRDSLVATTEQAEQLVREPLVHLGS